MHAIRSKARRNAWYDNESSSSRFNLVGRRHTNQSRPRDIEDGGRVPTHYSTENDLPSHAETVRREQFQANGDHLKRHGTSPTTTTDYSNSDGLANGSDLNNTRVDTGPSTFHPTPATTFEDGAVGTRKRRKFHLPGFMGGGKKTDDTNLEHTKSRSSSKSKGKQAKIPVKSQIKAVFASWLNILLVFVPIGLAMEYGNVNGILSFVMNFIAIIPLASVLSFATEELAFYVGDTFGGLLNATFGNATELIVSVIALVQGKVTIVKTSLIGSMLSNLLLVLGMCFFFGGLNRREQFFNITVAQTAASLLALAIGALVTPTAFRIFSDVDTGVQPLSHAAAILLLLIYLAYMVFQLRTHIDMYNEPSQKVEKENLLKKKPADKSDTNADATKGVLQAGSVAGGAAGRPGDEKFAGETASQDTSNDDTAKEDEHIPQLSKAGALITLAIATALIAVTSDGMVSGIDSIEGAITEEFIGLILVPIVGNAAEHATAVTVAIKDKMDLAIGVAVGSSLQIALLLIPIMVLLYWFGLGQHAAARTDNMDLNFDGFQIVVLFIAMILVNYVIQDGRSHWLEGVMLFITYVIFAVAAWYYPASDVPN